MFSLIPPEKFLPTACWALFGIGVVVGLLGSFFSVSKYLRWKR